MPSYPWKKKLLLLTLLGCALMSAGCGANLASTAFADKKTDSAPASPTASFAVDTIAIGPGGSAQLRWTTRHGASVVIDHGIGQVAAQGSLLVSPAQTTTYHLTASNGAMTAQAVATVQIVDAPVAIFLYALPDTIGEGRSTKLIWDSPGAALLDITGVGVVASPGFATISPAATTTYFATVADSGNSSASITVNVLPKSQLQSKIKHIVFLAQENRSFDNYFGMLGSYRRQRGYPGYIDGFNPNIQLVDSAGDQVKPYHFQTVCHENLTPSWDEAHYDTDLMADGRYLMDRFLQTTASQTQTFDPHGTRAAGYYDQTDLPYYYELASQFGTSDRFFSSVLASTPPNRMYLFAATSFGHTYGDLDPNHPKYTQKTIFEVLNDAGVNWKYYYTDNNIFLAQFAFGQQMLDQCAAGGPCRFQKMSEYFSLLSSPNADADFPEVVFIERTEAGDEHPLNNIQEGAANTKTMIDALMNSAAWQSSVFILTYDEGGGLYDHVPPEPMVTPDDIPPDYTQSALKVGNFDQTGFRLPFTIISPWVRQHYVSHVPRELTSILALIESRFNLPPLTRRDAAADDLQEFFDFSAPQLLNVPPLPAQPVAPIDPATGRPTNCNFSLEAAPGEPNHN